MIAGFALVEWKKVEGYGCVVFGDWENVSKGGIAWNNEREAPPRVGEKFNEGVGRYELGRLADPGSRNGLVCRVK